MLFDDTCRVSPQHDSAMYAGDSGLLRMIFEQILQREAQNSAKINYQTLVSGLAYGPNASIESIDAACTLDIMNLCNKTQASSRH